MRAGSSLERADVASRTKYLVMGWVADGTWAFAAEPGGDALIREPTDAKGNAEAVSDQDAL